MMELRDEAVTVRTMAPAEAHIAASPQCGILTQPQGMENHILLPIKHLQVRETLCCLHAQLGDLNDSELQQLIKDLTQEIAQQELIVTPQQPSS